MPVVSRVAPPQKALRLPHGRRAKCPSLRRVAVRLGTPCRWRSKPPQPLAHHDIITKEKRDWITLEQISPNLSSLPSCPGRDQKTRPPGALRAWAAQRADRTRPRQTPCSVAPRTGAAPAFPVPLTTGPRQDHAARSVPGRGQSSPWRSSRRSQRDTGRRPRCRGLGHSRSPAAGRRPCRPGWRGRCRR